MKTYNSDETSINAIITYTGIFMALHFSRTRVGVLTSTECLCHESMDSDTFQYMIADVYNEYLGGDPQYLDAQLHRIHVQFPWVRETVIQMLSEAEDRKFSFCSMDISDTRLDANRKAQKDLDSIVAAIKNDDLVFTWGSTYDHDHRSPICSESAMILIYSVDEDLDSRAVKTLLDHGYVSAKEFYQTRYDGMSQT